MSEFRQLLELWREARASGEEVCLATVVQTEGSSYRKPGARMLITRGGRRAGTVSGGCLEGEVQKKAWWLAESGAAVQKYNTFFDEDSEMPYGLGCGGTVSLLLERKEAAEAVLAALEENEEQSCGLAIVSVIDTNPLAPCGTRVILGSDGRLLYRADAGGAEADAELIALARQAIRERRALWGGVAGTVFAEYVAPPPALFVFGAGDDAQPLVEFAYALGWRITVVDGRAHLATRERFPLAKQVLAGRSFVSIDVREQDAAVILTHSYEQDRAALRALLPREVAYLGILGPRHRTRQLLEEVAPEIGLTLEECLARLHSPVGLNIGAKTPTSIALAIAAEVHAVLARTTGPVGEGRDAKPSGQISALHA
jgi:xanthine dehydrogenase accessory factor